MPAGHDQEKTEPATPKKRQEARRKGQVAQSREVPTLLILFSAFSLFFFAGNWMFMQVVNIMSYVFNFAGQANVNIETAHLLLWELFQRIVIILIPLFIVVTLAGVGANVAQIGLLITAESMTPKLSKLNPISGIKKLFSLRALVELAKSILKVIIVGSVSYTMLKGETESISALVHLNITSILEYIGYTSLKIGFYTCLVLIVLAGLDLFFQRWKHERDLRMTKQEVKDEHKQREGDPMVRSRIRAAQREMAMRRMMEAVPDATVVITNPTHLAIALKFERRMQAPQVVAKGANLIAERIKDIAERHDIPIIEQKPLARALYKQVEINAYIPAELYHAVAEILAYVYRLKGLVD